METRLTNVEKVCEDLRNGQEGLGVKLVGVEVDMKETRKDVNKILTNHLPHIQDEIKWTKWVVVFGMSIIAILVGLFGAIGMIR